MAKASNVVDIQYTSEVLERMGDSPSKDMSDSNINQQEFSQENIKPNGQSDLKNLATDSQSNTHQRTDYLKIRFEDPLQSESKQKLCINKIASEKTFGNISKASEMNKIMQPLKMSNSELPLKKREVIKPLVLEKTDATKENQPPVYDKSTATEVTQLSVHMEIKPTEVIQLSVHDEIKPTEVIQLSVHDEIKPTEVIQLSVHDEIKPTEVIQLSVHDEIKSTEVIQLSVHDEIKPTEVIQLSVHEENKPTEATRLSLHEETRLTQPPAYEESTATELTQLSVHDENKPTEVTQLSVHEETRSTKENQSPVYDKIESTEKVQPPIHQENGSIKVFQILVHGETEQTQIIKLSDHERTGPTEIIQSYVPKGNGYTEIIQLKISNESEQTETVETDISKEITINKVIQPDVLEEIESTELIQRAFSKESFASEVVQPVLFNERVLTKVVIPDVSAMNVSTKVVQLSNSEANRSEVIRPTNGEAYESEVIEPKNSEVNGFMKLIQSTSSKVKESTKAIEQTNSEGNKSPKIIQSASSETNESTKVIQLADLEQTESTKVSHKAKSEKTVLNKSLLDSLEPSSKEDKFPIFNRMDQIFQNNVMNLSAIRTVSTGRICDYENIVNDMKNFSPFQEDEFKNGTIYFVRGASCCGHVLESPRPLTEPIFPDFKMPPIPIDRNVATGDSQTKANFSAPAFKMPSIPIDANIDTGDSQSLVVPNDKFIKISMSSLLSSLVDWKNTGMDKIFNRPKADNISGLLEYTDKKLLYGLTLLKQMDNHVLTLLKAVAGLPDAPLPYELSGPGNTLRDRLNNAGSKVRRLVDMLKVEITSDYDRFVKVSRSSPNINKGLESNQLEDVTLNIIANSFVKVAENHSSLKVEILKFHNLIQDFYLDLSFFL